MNGGIRLAFLDVAQSDNGLAGADAHPENVPGRIRAGNQEAPVGRAVRLLEMILLLQLLHVLLDGREFYSRALLDLLSLALRTEKSADTQ